MQKLQRDINCLADDNRTSRKRALTKLIKDLFDPAQPADVLQELAPHIVKPVLKVFPDSMEKNRELSIVLIAKYIRLFGPFLWYN